MRKIGIMRIMRTRIMMTVMMKSCNHLLMRWTFSFSSWIPSKLCKHQIHWGSRTLHRGLTSMIKHLLMVLPSMLNKGKQRLERKKMEKASARAAS